MEVKTMILSVLIMSLVMGQIQVQAKICCPSTHARNVYNVCLLAQRSRTVCANLSGCKIVQDNKCPSGFPNEDLKNSGHDVIINEYCTLGCASSVCGAIITLQSYDESEIVNGAVEQCTKACSTFCTKGSITASEIA